MLLIPIGSFGTRILNFDTTAQRNPSFTISYSTAHWCSVQCIRSITMQYAVRGLLAAVLAACPPGAGRHTVLT